MNSHRSPSLQEIFDQLEQQQLLTHADKVNILAADSDRAEPSTPLFAKILAGIGAWLAAWFLLLFLALSLSFNIESPAWLWIGVVLFSIGLALQTRLLTDDGVFIGQFSLALWIVGQILILFGSFQILESYGMHYGTHHALILLLIQLALSGGSYALSRQFALRWLAAIAVFGWAWWALPLVLHLFVLIGLLCWLWRPMQSPVIEPLQPLAWAVLWAVPCSLLASDLQILWFLRDRDADQPLLFWLGTSAQGILALGLLLTVAQLSHWFKGWSMRQRLLCISAIVLLSVCSPASVTAALLLLVLGFANDRLSIQVIAVLFLSYALWLLYYTLHLSLAEKSALMMATGLLLLGSGWLLGRMTNATLPKEQSV